MKHRPFFIVALSGLALVLYFLYKFSLYPYTLESRHLGMTPGELQNFTDLPPFFLPEQERLLNVDGNGRRRLFVSKDVIVRAVYFDDRLRNGHINASVFLALVWKPITDNKLVTGCQIDGVRAEKYDVRLIGETKMWRIYPNYNKIDHEEVLIHCYDLPARNGSDAFLYYKISNTTEEKKVKTERAVMFPAPRVSPTSKVGVKYNLSLLTCTKVYGNPPWLKEWLIYQRAIGVDHVHFIADESFFRGINKELSYYVEGLIQEGFLSVDFWIMWLNNGKEVWYHNQGLILEDCMYQFRGTYDYIFILDTDDFFTPRVSKEPHVHYYVDKFCRKDKASSCKFRWVEYYPDHFGLNTSAPLIHGNMTSQLKNYNHTNQGNRKSIHSSHVVIDVATHYAFDILPGYQRIEVPVYEAYVAHIRKGKKPEVSKLKKGLP